LSNLRIFSGSAIAPLSKRVAAAQALKEEGAVDVVAYVTHPVFSGRAVEKIANSDLNAMVVTDTKPLGPDVLSCDEIERLSMDRMLAEAVRGVSNEESISAMCR
tara:strand:- start:9690 stop:10001 length:312 start_codon:yes stop_codon:yes gene_type:complete